VVIASAQGQVGRCAGRGVARTDESSGGGEQAQPQPLGFVVRGGGAQHEAGAPGQQVLGERGDGDPDPVLVGVVEGYLEPISAGP
jgi:hypothetical protein